MLLRHGERPNFGHDTLSPRLSPPPAHHAAPQRVDTLPRRMDERGVEVRPARSRSAFLDAAMSRPVPRTPVWFMRQAGRSLPEYRAIRGEGSILEAIKRPETAAEITLQPVRRYGVDAAVLYSDIIVPAHAVGFGVDVAPGTGPVAERPLRTRGDLARLRPLEPDDVAYVIDTVGLVREALPADVPVLAFAGAPFTVASYLIEGAPSRTYEHTKALIHTDERLWHEVMDRLAAMAVAFVDVQLTAGAQAFQLFDSWAGTLARPDYERYVQPHSRRVFAELAERHPAAPGIHFGIGCDHLLEPMWSTGPKVMGLDWRTSITGARTRLGADVVVQGNLDPSLVLAGAPTALEGARRVLADNGDHPGHIFNLGHGVHPTTDPGVLAAIVDLVHAETAR
jgi:uroporphyrinogen decarboxylase